MNQTGLTITITDDVGPRLARFGRRARAMAVSVARRVGYAYRRVLRRRYLSGQYLGVVSGQTKRKVKVIKARGKDLIIVWSPLANIYEHPGGVDIRPKERKVLRWFDRSGKAQFARHVHLRQRPFMSDSVDAFAWNREIGQAADAVIERELKRQGLR